jgi:hypothetical protein
MEVRMRSKPHPALALLGAALLAAALGGCNFGRNVSDDCWVDQTAFDAANRYRAGLRARNLPPNDGAWAVAEARIGKARQNLRACEDGAPGTGRPRVEDLSHGHAGGHAAVEGHGA